MAINILNLPGMGGATGSIVVESIQALEDGAQCVGTEGANLLACFRAIIDLGLLAYDLYQEFFPSRPKLGKDSATDDAALFLIPSANPVITLWGIGTRQLETLGIPISTSGGPGLTAEVNLADAVLSDLQKQFDGPHAPKLSYQGVPITGEQLFSWYHMLAFQTANPDSNRVAINNRIQLDALYTQLVNQGYLDPVTGFPKPEGPPPPLPPGGPEPGDPDQDELQDCCDETQAAFAKLISALAGIGGAGTDTACCINVVSAIGQVAAQLTNIVEVLPTLAAQPLNLDQVSAQLAAIAAELGKLGTGAGAPITVHLANTLPLATATAIAPATDVSGIVDQLKALAQEDLLSTQLVNYLAAQGFNTDGLAAVIQQVNTAAVAAVAGAAAPPPPPITGITWVDALINALVIVPWNGIVFALKNAGITWTGTGFTLSALSNTIAGFVDSAVTTALNAGAVPLEAPIRGIVDAVVTQLRPAHAPAIGDSGVDPELLLAKTLAPALIVNAVMLVADYLGWEISEQLKEYVDWIAELAGLAEVKEVLVGQLMHAGPIAAARLQAQRQFRQTIPGPGAMAGWASRGITDQRAMMPLMQMDGLHDQLSELYFEAAYSGINPRQLIRLMNTGLFNNADITDELTFAGLRPASQHRLLLAAPYLASDGERKQLRAELEAAYGQGLLSPVELADQLDSAEQNTDRNSLVLAKVSLQSQVTLTKALETEFTTGYVAGATTQLVYEQQVRGLPIQAWKADAIIGVAEARRNATLFRQDAAAARALERATAAVERRTAMKSYASGFSNAAELTAALLLTGLTATEAVAWSALAALEKEGNVRWAYGMQLTPEAATILKQRVAAVTDQRKHALMTDAQYEEALKLLKLPDNWINALRAAANATLTPAKQRTFTAVSTS
jgi:hypothetical protein